MRPTVLLLLAVPLLPLATAAQQGCASAPRAAAAPAAEVRPLFQQAGILFQLRAAAGAPPALRIVNRNATAVEVGYSLVLLPLSDSAGSVPASLGRHCVRLGAGEAGEIPLRAGAAGAPDPARLQVRNLSVDLLGDDAVPLAGGRITPVEPAPPRSVRPPQAAPQEPPAASREQFGCLTGTDALAQLACTAAYMAASARAAAAVGGFAGVTRGCLLQYADAQERAAALARAGDEGARAAAGAAPPCFEAGAARWDFGALARFCREARWTVANQGTPSCELPGATPAAAPPESLPAPLTGREGRGGATASPEAPGNAAPATAQPSPRRHPPLRALVGGGVRILCGGVLTLAALAILYPALQALWLLAVLAPLALLRRAFRTP